MGGTTLSTIAIAPVSGKCQVSFLSRKVSGPVVSAIRYGVMANGKYCCYAG